VSNGEPRYQHAYLSLGTQTGWRIILKLIFKKMCFGNSKYIQLALCCFQWLALLIVVSNLRVL
jgi:hypothetical protein